MSGTVNYHAGLAAEQAVAAQYLRSGHRLLGHRWRGKGGEIDLILEKAGACIFVEVKKSRTFQRAAESLGGRQVNRIMRSAEEFLARRPEGTLTPARVDVALVNALGEIQVLENATLA